MSSNVIEADSRRFSPARISSTTVDVPQADKLESLYRSSLAADIEWSRALRMIFGRSASAARRDHRGVSTPELRDLKEKKVAAEMEWRNALHATRKPLTPRRALAA